MSDQPDVMPAASRPRWLDRGVGGIGGASLLADLGHEVPTSLLPSLLTSILHAPASALGLIAGVLAPLLACADSAEERSRMTRSARQFQ